MTNKKEVDPKVYINIPEYVSLERTKKIKKNKVTNKRIS